MRANHHLRLTAMADQHVGLSVSANQDGFGAEAEQRALQQRQPCAHICDSNPLQDAP